MNNSPLSFFKRHKSTFFLAAGFLTGLLIFIYPIVSQYYADHHHTRVIDTYQESIDNMAEEELQQHKQQFESYNSSLSGGITELADPFSETEEEAVSAESFIDSFDVFSQYLGETVGYIDIPDIDAYLPIYAGTNEDILQKGIGLLEGTSYPVGGAGTHSVLTGHRGLPTSALFTDLPKMEMGDVFYLHVLDETLAYKVEEILTVLPHETEHITIEEGKDLITLITCTPYMINTHRLLVRGSRIPYEAETTIEDSALPVQIPPQRMPNELVLLLVAAAAALIFFFFRRNRNKKKGGSRR